VWGPSEKGFYEPLVLPLDTNLTSVARTNSTYGHHGEMALWQMFGIKVLV
jgi:hypothetical protein